MLSCEVRCRKPDPAIYRHLLGLTDVPAERPLFVDDKPKNVRGARRAGMHAVVFTGERAFMRALEDLGVAP